MLTAIVLVSFACLGVLFGIGDKRADVGRSIIAGTTIQALLRQVGQHTPPDAAF